MVYGVPLCAQMLYGVALCDFIVATDVVGRGALSTKFWWTEALRPPKVGGQRRCVHHLLVDEGRLSTNFW